MDASELRKACERAGLPVDACNFALISDDGAEYLVHLTHPMLPAYVAERLVELVLATDKAWSYSLSRDDGYGATCWTAEWARRGRKIQCVECLFIVPDNLDASKGGSAHVAEGNITVIWCRGEDDDDSFCGKAEVEIRAAMAVLP